MRSKEKVDSLTFLEHLEELRRRIIAVLTFWLIAFGICYVFVDKILSFFFRPLTPFQPKPVFTRPTEPFLVTFGVCALVAALISLPVLIAQIWLFVAPGLTTRERQLSRWVLLGLVVFSFSGMAFGFFFLVPVGLKVLLGFARQTMTPLISAGSYLGFVAMLTLGLGAVFNLPVVLGALAACGLVEPAALRGNRRLAVVLALVVAAVITPTTDIVTQLLLGTALVVLYEIGIIFASVFRHPSN